MLKNLSLGWVDKQDDAGITDICNKFFELAKWLKGDDGPGHEAESNTNK